TEADEFIALPDASKELAFLELWTAKEAYLKAIGTGLTQELRSVEVCRKGQRLRALDSPSGSETNWSLAYFQPNGDTIAALSWTPCDHEGPFYSSPSPQ